MSQNDPINEKVDRIETIIETLEDGDVSIDRAQDLHEEGQSVLDDLREELDVGDGTVVEK